MRRVLIIAEAANPEWVSVPLVGWSIASALRDVADVHIVTQIRNRDAFTRAGLTEGRDFTAIDSETVARPLHRFSKLIRGGKGKGWTTAQAISSLSYVWFERLVWRRFGVEIRRGDWDVVHRVTPLSPTVSSRLAPLCRQAGVPFVLGPLNGGVPWPKAFDTERRSEREWLSYVRGVYKLLPGRTATLAASDAIIVGSRHTQSEIPDRFQDRCIYIPENAIDPGRFNRRAAPGTHPGPLRACFVGRLVPYKGADMLIAAASAMLRSGRMTIDLIGDGPMAGRIDAQIEKEGVGDSVRRLGWIEHHEVQDIMVDCDLMVLPSIREFGGGVVLEAMALGIPPVVIDYAGPGELVDADVGFKIPMGDRDGIVSSLRRCLEGIEADRSNLAEMGMRAHERVQECFTWQRKARQIAEIYDWVLKERADRPVFFAPRNQTAPSSGG